MTWPGTPIYRNTKTRLLHFLSSTSSASEDDLRTALAVVARVLEIEPTGDMAIYGHAYIFYLSIHLSIHLLIYLSIYSSIIYLSIYLFIHCLLIYLFMYLLSTYLFSIIYLCIRRDIWRNRLTWLWRLAGSWSPKSARWAGRLDTQGRAGTAAQSEGRSPPSWKEPVFLWSSTDWVTCIHIQDKEESLVLPTK